MTKEFFEELFKKQMLNGVDYIDSRSRASFRKWTNNRLKKYGMEAYTKGLKTDVNGKKKSK